MSGLEAEDDVSLEQLLEQTRDSWFNEVHTTFPARVESYDAGEQVADLKPMVRRAMPTRSSVRGVEEFPILRAVRIAWDRGGGYFVHMPLKAGDFVHVHCAERDFTRWAVTGDVGDPVDDRNHHMSHAFAVPGFYPRTRKLAGMPTDAMVIGKEDGARVQIGDDGSVFVGTTPADGKKAANENVKDHLTPISLALDEIRAATAPLLGGGAPVVDPHYGAAAKLVLDSSKPVAATKVSVE